MTNVEKQHIKMLPKSLRPLSTVGYALYTILFALGPIGLIATIICAFSAKNVNVRRYARSVILLTVIGTVGLALLFVLGILNIELIQNFARDFYEDQSQTQQQVFAMISAFC